jgi:hypothetical protein
MIVEYAVINRAKQVTIKNGRKAGQNQIVVDIQRQNGEEHTAWYPADRQDILALEGTTTPIAIDSKGKVRIVESANTAPAPAPTQHRPIPNPPPQSKAAEIDTYINQRVALYRACWSRVAGQFDGLSEESIRAITTTIFIDTTRNFDL